MPCAAGTSVHAPDLYPRTLDAALSICYRVHTATSPNLVRCNERMPVAGEQISDGRLAQVVAEVFDASGGLGPGFCGVTIATAFSEYARAPAEACVVEVGLDG